MANYSRFHSESIIRTLEYLPYHTQDLQVLMMMLITGYILIH